MDAFKKAARGARGAQGIVRRFDGKPTRNPAEKVIPKVARRIQGLLGKCCICGRGLGGEPHVELGSIGGKNICAHLRCLEKEKRFSKTIQLQSTSQAEIRILDPIQIKKEVMRKAIEIGLCREVIEFVMQHFWEVLQDIESTRDLTPVR